MTKRIILAVAAFSITLAAQRSEGLEPATSDSTLGFSGTNAFSSVEASVLIHSLPMLGLLDGRTLPLATSLGEMGLAAPGFFPAAYLGADLPRVSTPARYDNEGSDKVADLRTRAFDYGGEAGVFYGKSTGKYGGEQWGSYFMGTVGNDKIQITAGASYEESTFHFRRGGR